MTTFLYGNASQQFATAQWTWTGLTVWGLLVDNSYLPKANVDVNVSDIPASAIVDRQGPLTSLTCVNGVCGGIIPTFNAVIATNPVKAIVLYVKGASDAASSLIYYSSDGIGFPFPAQGFNYAVAQDQAFGGWFQV